MQNLSHAPTLHLDNAAERARTTAEIADILRHITWHGQKHSLHTLSRPDIDLTIPQMVTLLTIRDVGSCRMSELADATRQSAGTLTGIVDRLIEDGLVHRVRDNNDRRVVKVELTSAGHERVRRVDQAHRDDMARILRYFEGGQLDQLHRMLQLLLQGLEHTFLPELLPVDRPAQNLDQSA